MTIETIIKNSPVPKFETEILLSFVLNKDRSYLNSFSETKLTKLQEEKILEFIARRTKHEPIPYILGYKEFFGLKFFVNENVLIPRPETEKLVEDVIYFCQTNENRSLKAVDVGTGSGCIAITLALKNPKLKIIATDISQNALEVAKKNAKLHKVSNRIIFLESDLLEEVNQKIDIIVTNLPYIPTENWKNLPIEIKDFEPKLALDSGKTAMLLYNKLFLQTKTKLNPNGKIFYELDGDINQVSAAYLAETPPE